MSKIGSKAFSGAMPKEEIGAIEFLKENPEADGRGVIIAILDTGVDPGAKGLQVTSDGKPKILDILDCTGSGDVDTSRVVEADAEGIILGYFDTPLRVNPDCKNPSGEWRVGYKRAYDLFPGGLQKRITGERKKRRDESQRAAVSKANSDLAELLAKHGKKSVTAEQLKEVEELEERVKLLTDIDSYKDPGPLIHAVVWHDGERWLAALDTSEANASREGSESPKGLLADQTPLADFALERQYGTFSREDACNYGVHFYSEGDILSIVVECGSHGTHVAGIAAAYHEDDPSLNGIAPGAQIISCKIGDSRLDGMETNVGLTRALNDVLRHKADLINLSYGEATATPNSGRFIELANEVVNKHGVMFISSAGNAGPALSSVGAPGGTSSSIISVGAYVSPDLAAAGHSVREPLEKGQQYTWSSRGPTPDGDLGVSVSAPGGAIAPVPNWSQQSRQLMNGTSMASPCACGGFALLLSGLKQTGQTVQTHRVRRAAENTCLPVNEGVSEWPLTYGHGLLQVHRAFKLLTEGGEQSQAAPDTRYEVKAKRTDSSVSGRGIYLREPLDVAGPSSHTVEVLPRLREGADTKGECLEVEYKVLLEVSADWVECPQMLLLPFNGRNFEVKVDPSRLPPGVHHAQVVGLDCDNESQGPLFRVPITVIIPLDSKTAGAGALTTGPQEEDGLIKLDDLHFVPGQETRNFVAVPEGATWGELRIRSGSFDTPKTFMIRASQLLPHTRYSDTEARQVASLTPNSEWTATFPVVGSSTLEVTLAQFWSSLGSSSVAVEVAFHGVEASPGALQLDGSAGVTKFYLRAPIRREKVAPTAKLTAVQIPLRPSEAVLAPLGAERDVFPGNRVVHGLELTYKLKVEEAGGHKPTLPMLNKYVYDSVVEAEMSMIYDSNRKLLGVGDIYPSETTLSKGEHTIKLLIRHDDTSILEKLRDLPMVVERKLKDPISVPVYPTNADAVKESNAVKDFVLRKGERRAVFLGPLTAVDKLPKDATPGRTLVGKLQLGKLSEGKDSKDAPSSVPFTFLVAPKKESKERPKVEEAAPEDSAKKLQKAVLNAKVKWLEEAGKKAEGEDAEAAQKLADELLVEDPKLLKALLWKLGVAESKLKEADGDNQQSATQAILEAADGVLRAVDVGEVAQFTALKNPEEGPGAKERKETKEEEKAAIVRALAAKARVLIGSTPSQVQNSEDAASTSGPSTLSPEAEAAFQELRKWVDTTSEEYSLLHARREAAAGRYASAIKALQKVLKPEDKAPGREAAEYEIELLGKLGWSHWQTAHRSLLADSHPPSFRLF